MEAAAYYDEDMTAWTAFTHWLSKTIHGDESVSTQVKEQVAQSLDDAVGGERGEDAVSARARLQDIRKRVGNSMQLAPCLMTREPQVNDRIALLASKQSWKEHAAAFWLHLGPAANLERAQSLAQGVFIDMISRRWWDYFSNAQEIAILGISSLQGSVGGVVCCIFARARTMWRRTGGRVSLNARHACIIGSLFNIVCFPLLGFVRNCCKLGRRFMSVDFAQ